MPVRLMLLFLAVLPVLAQAENDKLNNNEEQPDLLFLEFLGSFDEKDNVWLDAEIDEIRTARVEIKQEGQDHE